jgi:phospholipid/cholesterol/gamma-HCH transport system substrate-binding protein
MRTLQPANRVRIGALAIAVVLLVVAVGQSFGSVPVLFATASYYAQFSDSGGVSKGDKVRIVGMDVGTVQDLAIDGDHVVMKFSTGTHTIGTESRVAIRTDTLLGKKVLEIEPRGTQPMRPNGVLPLGQSTTPYQIYDAFFDVTKAAAGWNIDTVKQSLNVLSHTINQTYPHLSAALDGVAKFSDTIGKRDEQLKHLLTEARKVAGVLGDRSKQINALLRNTQALLAAFNQRGKAIEALLANVSAFSTQVRGLINDNPNLHHLLDQLRSVTDVLVAHKNDLVSVLNTLRNYTAALSEAVGSGPYFKVMIGNLVPYQILQPWVDAAFKKRGIDPENFWRSAGLPAFRFPDPNGTRFPNGAPPPAPPALEGTPDHPGPAVAPGSPCSYAPSPELLPRPGNPMPCAGVNQDQGPFGPNGPYPVLPDVASSPPNPNGLPPTPGIPIAGRPGAPAPDLPGTPVPMAPGPPGARTEPVGPAGPTPPPSTFAPGLPPGPPAPSGPGNNLPAPLIPNTGGAGGSGAQGGSQN